MTATAIKEIETQMEAYTAALAKATDPGRIAFLEAVLALGKSILGEANKTEVSPT